MRKQGKTPLSGRPLDDNGGIEFRRGPNQRLPIVAQVAENWTPNSNHRGMNEQVIFRYIVMPCCHHQVCWVNPRLPNYCPECGENIMARVREAVYVEAPAWLRMPGVALKIPAQPEPCQHDFDYSGSPAGKCRKCGVHD